MVQIVVDKELVKRVAQNARLSLNDKELERFVPQIKEVILDSFNKLDEVDVTNTQPSFQPIQLKNRFRVDEPKRSFTQEEALRNVSQKLREKGYFKGPKVL